MNETKNYFIIALLVILLSAPFAYAEEAKKITENPYNLYEVSISSGYAYGELKRGNDDYNIIPLFLHFGWSVNNRLGINNEHKGTLSAGIEPLVNTIIEPDGGIEIGFNLFLKYDYPLKEKLLAFIKAGSGPIYLGINTVEQSNAGFNFLNQGEVGLQYYISEDKTINLSYQYRHISNADLRNGSNGGIDSQSVIVGLSKFY